MSEAKPAILHGLIASFDSAAAAAHAAEAVRDRGFRRWDVHTPYPVHGMDAAMGLGRSKLPFLVFFGGLTGFLTGTALAFITQTLIYPTIVQGKPANFATAAAFFPPMYELTILFSGFTVLFGLLGLCGLPRWNHPLFEHKDFARVTDDKFFVVIEAQDPLFHREETAEFLETLHPESVSLVEVPR